MNIILLSVMPKNFVLLARSEPHLKKTKENPRHLRVHQSGSVGWRTKLPANNRDEEVVQAIREMVGSQSWGRKETAGCLKGRY